MVALFQQKKWDKSDNFKSVIRSLISKLSDGEIDDFITVVSEELQATTDLSQVSLTIKVIPNELWTRIHKMPRIRVENMLIKSVAGAWYIPDAGETNEPASTWLSNVAPYFSRKDSLRVTLIKKLREADFDHHNFVAVYLLQTLPQIFEEENQVKLCTRAITDCIRRGNACVKDQLLEAIDSLPSQWQDELVENLRDLTDPDEPEIYLAVGIPLLGKFVAQPNPATLSAEDEIPF